MSPYLPVSYRVSTKRTKSVYSGRSIYTTIQAPSFTKPFTLTSLSIIEKLFLPLLCLLLFLSLKKNFFLSLPKKVYSWIFMNTTRTTATTKNIPTNRGAAGEIESFVMANCRSMLLSSQKASVTVAANSDEHVGRMFECKTCGHKFPSFQALGGHRASHKKAKSQNSGEFSDEVIIPAKSKIHACKICGVEFPTGQALGGHMRRHREALEGSNGSDEKKMLMLTSAVSSVTTDGSFENSDANNVCCEEKRKIVGDDEEVALEVPVTKKSNSCKRVRLDVDLELSLWWNKQQLEEYSNAVEEGKKW